MADKKKTANQQWWNPPGTVYWKGNLKFFLLIVLNYILVLLVDIFLLGDLDFLSKDRQTIMIVIGAVLGFMEGLAFEKLMERRKKEKEE